MNNTVITEFVLLGLSDDPLFITYVFSVTGNLIIITLTWMDCTNVFLPPKLLFLRNLLYYCVYP